MSAGESASKRQFGWAEETSHVTRSAGEGRGALSRGYSALRFIDKSSITDIGDSGDTRHHHWGDALASVQAEWRHVSPRPWTDVEIQSGENEEGYGRGHRQLTMFHPGESYGPKITSLSSTEEGRFASARGVGLMANILQRETGHTDVQPSNNLSARSAPLVTKLTGQEIRPSNKVGFDSSPTFRPVPAPDAPDDISTRTATTGMNDDSLRTHTVRWLNEDEVTAGNQRLRQHLRIRRSTGPKGPPVDPTSQIEMFPR